MWWGKDLEYRDAMRAAWRTYYAKRDLWRTHRLPVQQIRALHLSVFPVLTWCGVTRGWTMSELKGLRTEQRTSRLAEQTMGDNDNAGAGGGERR